MIASRPLRSASAIQASILARACASAPSSFPKWWRSAPQQTSPLSDATSTPSRVSKRSAAALIRGCKTCCTQPWRIAPRAVDQMHVVHARRAGRHAREAGKAPVDMLNGNGVGRPLLFEHILDEVDSPARTIELVAKQHKGRAGRGAKAAVNAGAQNLVGLRDVRIFELRGRKMRLHV